MRADVFSRPPFTCRLIGLSLIALAATGCKTEKDPDQPTLLGAPPTTAYLGVEYYYNWGAYGGESILDYALTNAPSWLALEDTSNKARQGVIMRGVPGFSGGARGEADLGKTENIDIVSTDGRMSGFQPFDIEVKRNVLSLEAPMFAEGQSPEVSDSSRERCALPDLETLGEHDYNIDLYESDGSSNTSKSVTSATNRVFVKVLLDQPSVTRVAVAFELRSEFDANACDDEQTPPHQSCEYSSNNLGRAIIGNDIVARGSGSAFPTDEDGDKLDYITLFQNDQGVYDHGVITLEPGITECYIPLEIIDDKIPEPSELAQLYLTEIRTGIASLGASNTEVRTNLTIQDNEPVVSIETMNGGPRDTLNIGNSGSYRAILSGDREVPVSVRLTQAQGSTARLGTEFAIEQEGVVNATLEFPLGRDEVLFDIRVDDGYTAPDDLNDRFAQLAVDNVYQAGREGFARGASDNLLRLSFNRLFKHLGWIDGFVPTDFTVGHGGRLFVAGYEGNQVQVRVYDQAGDPVGNTVAVATLATAAQPDVFVDVAERRVAEGTTRVTRYEMAVAFSTNEAIGAGDVSGSTNNVVTGLYRLQTGDEYQLRWDELHRIGTSGDDRVRWVGLNAGSGYVVVAGETNGTWIGETAVGGVDAFLARIDSLPDGESLVPTLVWSRQVGSSGDDRVVGGSVSGVSPLLFGSAPVSVDGTAVIGPFFFAGSASGSPTVYQVGEDSSEILKHGFYGDGSVWLIGDAPRDYSVQDKADDDTELMRAPLDNRAGFALGYSTSGAIGTALMAKALNDNASVTLSQGMLFNGDIVIAGNTDGEFAEEVVQPGAGQGILARLNRSDDDVAYRTWRRQLEIGGLKVIRLKNYRDDEIVALVDRNGNREIRVFSPEGESLTSD
ncbi:hypothetical protein [Marinobacter halophilus]|uniref:CARDB domain-containing protein n=1 Tax=Marinobacter halophilus TaxID=1323740 RepID=A0A2T1KH26_9GAMM|nr:hypothetical protein [Marinobacter halophilus]PSF09441.1 hypothetical protein C7H08_05100 [Marinobacter halophilus]GGC77772.1 hypothetical protein GCM10011362_27920 [Marinobacter halophilus]